VLHRVRGDPTGFVSVRPPGLRSDATSWAKIGRLAQNRDVSLDVIDPSGRIALMRLNHLQPPFNDVRVRQAVRLAVQQEDYMRASQGDDSSAWQTCRNLWPRGTLYYAGEQADLMPQDPGKAAAALKASGYSGQCSRAVMSVTSTPVSAAATVPASMPTTIGMPSFKGG